MIEMPIRLNVVSEPPEPNTFGSTSRNIPVAIQSP
jgi:hypothetical protein